MIGVRGDGTKELIALADGFRESAKSWADLLREGKRRGMAAPVLAIGDGALGFCKAIRAVFPDTREQRCWFHAGGQRAWRTAAVGAPRREGGAGRDLQRRGQGPRTQGGQGIRGPLRRQVAQGGRQGHRAPRRAARLFMTTRPNTGCICAPRTRSSRPSQPSGCGNASPKGPGSRAAGVAMAFKLTESAQRRWRAVNAPHLVAPVRAGAKFDNGKLIERHDESRGDQQVA